LLPFLVLTVLVFGNAVLVITLSTLLGRTTHNPHKDMPYESGMAPTGSARLRMSVPYYLVAIFFIMFDVELAFLWPWAYRMQELSWDGFLKALVFIVFLAAGLAYIWLRGGLKWRHHSSKASSKASSSLD
jgi:NADH-quinone oxidoreductase subunit A